MPSEHRLPRNGLAHHKIGGDFTFFQAGKFCRPRHGRICKRSVKSGHASDEQLRSLPGLRPGEGAVFGKRELPCLRSTRGETSGSASEGFRLRSLVFLPTRN